MVDGQEASRARRERLAGEQKEAWASVLKLLLGVRDACASMANGRGLAEAYSIEEATRIYETKGQALLVDALEGFERARPIRRSLNAIEDYDREGGDAALRQSIRRRWLDGAMQVVLGKTLLSLNLPWLIWLESGSALNGASQLAKWRERVANYEKVGDGNPGRVRPLGHQDS